MMVGGVGSLMDPFLELTAGVTTPAIPKSTILNASPCVSNGTLAGSIIGTLILCAFIGFLTWLTYLRPKLQELHEKQTQSYSRTKHPPIPSSNAHHKQQTKRPQADDHPDPIRLPLEVTDYKFGTFPFRQSQNSSANGHYNRTDWLNRVSSSFRSMNIDHESEMIDVELLDPTFGGLNFSITGNMRAGIFVKEILNKSGQTKSNATSQLKTGDRIMALTVCFESIVYEDALTVLSYASPYPVILRVQRPSHPTKVQVITEKRPTISNTTTSKVKWRDDFEHYDNDTRSNAPSNPLPPVPSTPSKAVASSSSKKPRVNASTQPRSPKKSSATNKGNKPKTSSSSILATSGATTKRSTKDIKKRQVKPTPNQVMVMSTGLTAKPPVATNTKTMKSVTDAVISYLHYKGGNGGVEQTKDGATNSEATMIPYYDSPYDYSYGGQLSQYQYLHQSQLNKNNNNSLSAESLTAVTPNLTTSVYTLQLCPRKASLPSYSRRCERRLSSPAVVMTEPNEQSSIEHIKDYSFVNIDTSV